ncbi:large-conductance mechanosensitive channel protein MscL [Maribacter ulvicola]|uniref:Large-conductance mechanosensitive channel n=1 Tax=Maribacter ulvicola TaxID=228959 RepID=A0A1N6YPT1_9FLAO|nr:large-conductance mechanosensitive channel protein MscL [Maribacter ulvicola]SIR16566.1 large conductance mechanosensitive channel [Maribacter ulvicola]
MKKFLEEFKNFAIKGNMIDLAVGIIVGTAFNKVISTIVSAVIMPPLSLLTDDVKLSNKKWILREAADSVEEVAVGYGELIESLIDFGIIAFTIFVMVKFINRFKEKSEDPSNKEVETPKNIALLSNMEKLLQEQNAILKNKK